MKKLMIAVAIICAAAISQGATISWTMTAVTGTDGKQAAAGLATYLVDASKYTAFTALEGEAIAKFFDTASNYKAASVVKAGRGASSVSFPDEGSYAAKETGSAFIVIFDNASAGAAEKYAYTAIGSATINEAGGDSNYTFGTFADAMAAGGSSAGWQNVSAGPTPVPEPTSGLLLLLGMGGLALRRRRA